MCLLVDFQCVSVWKSLAAHLAVHRFLTGVKLLDVETEVSLATTGGGTEFTLVDRLVSSVDSAMSLQTVTLGEPGVADITLVRFLPSVDPEVSLEFEGVRTGIGAVRTLVGSLSTVTSHVSLELTKLH